MSYINIPAPLITGDANYSAIATLTENVSQLNVFNVNTTNFIIFSITLTKLLGCAKIFYVIL